MFCFFFFQAEDGIRDLTVTGVQTCALPILCARPLLGGELDAHHGTALQPGRGPERRTVTGDAFVGDEAGGYRAGQRELIGYEAGEPLGFGGDDAESDGGHQGSAALGSFARSCARPSSPRETDRERG